MAGIERAAATPFLPFFIDWGRGTAYPGRVPAHHRAGDVRLKRLDLVGDSVRLAAWLGLHRIPISVRAGPASVASVVVAGAGGEFVLEAGRSRNGG
jgi:hypothetical protein